jgi:hypothetical protein
MIRRSEDQWRELFEAHARSGLSVAAFCREKKLSANYFSLRRRQLLDESAKPKAKPFVAARVSALPLLTVIEVQAGAVRLRLPESVPAGWLVELVRGLSHADV